MPIDLGAFYEITEPLCRQLGISQMDAAELISAYEAAKASEQPEERVFGITQGYREDNMPSAKQPVERTYPKLLSDDEKKALLKKAEELWGSLEENKLGGFSGINRPFLILSEFKKVIEQYGKRDVGLTWSYNDLQKAKPPEREVGEEVSVLKIAQMTIDRPWGKLSEETRRQKLEAARDSIAAHGFTPLHDYWRPIETAPLNEASILYSRLTGPVIRIWGEFVKYNHPEYKLWMPIPAPPTNDIEDGETK